MEKVKKPFVKRLWWKILAGIIAAILIFFFICAVVPRNKVLKNNPLMIEKNSSPILIAHGGGNKEFPDNTLEAFYHAYSIDSRVMMETDVNITKDNVVILSHDRSLSRKTNMNAHIIDVNYADLINDEVDFNYSNATTGSNGLWADGVNENNLTKYKNYNNAEVLPTDVDYSAAVQDGILSAGVMPRHNEYFLATTLEELLRAFPNNLVNVEIKQENDLGISCLDAVIGLMDKLEAEGIPVYNRVVLASFHKAVYNKLLSFKSGDHENIMFSPETKGVTRFFILQAIGLDVFFTDKTACLQIPMEQSGIKLYTKGFIKNAHKHNIAVHYWTINDIPDMELLCRNGADGIMTDIPSRLKEVLDRLYP